jgi:hypothetical protein
MGRREPHPSLPIAGFQASPPPGFLGRATST